MKHLTPLHKSRISRANVKHLLYTPFFSRGYVWITIKICNRYASIKYHRYKMENHLHRRLKSSEIIHHIDEDRRNNRLNNLELHTRGSHVRLHHKGKHVSKLVRQKISMSKKGTLITEQCREASSKAHKDVKLSTEHKLAISRGMKLFCNKRRLL